MTALSTPTPNAPARAWAEYWARLGIAVFPVKMVVKTAGTVDKVPLTLHGFKDATTDLGQVGAYWRQHPTAAIGAAVPPDVSVVDLDPRHGGDESWKKLVAEHGGIGDTFVYRTGGGGLHIWLRGDLPQTEGKIALGVDTRSAGKGFVVLPPSLYPTGTRYQIVKGNPNVLVSIPDWLIALAGTPNGKSKAEPLPAEIVEGERETWLVSFAGSMRERGATEEDMYDALTAVNNRRCSPPLEDSDIRRISRSIARHPAGERVPVDMGALARSDFANHVDPDAKPSTNGGGWLTIDELLAADLSATKWLVDGLVPARGLTLATAKPKVGKTTLARAVAVAVATGKPILGRTTTQGPVLYLQFTGEGNLNDAQSEFRALGAADAPLHYRLTSWSPALLSELDDVMSRVKPVLLIADTLPKLANVENMNDYAETNRRLDPILRLCEKHDTALWGNAHSRKSTADDPIDAASGSNAWTGSSETIIVLERDGANRFMRTVQRTGKEIDEPMQLFLDPETHWPSFGRSKIVVLRDIMESRIIEYVKDRGEATGSDIDQSVEGGIGRVRTTRVRMISDGKLVLSRGEGKKNDPRWYTVASDFATEETLTEDEGTNDNDQK